MREHLLKVGVSGIRGVVGEFLTPSLACAFAQAFGAYVGAGRVVVGRDSRSSGPMLQHAVTCGLLASGCEAIDVGVTPTSITIGVSSRAWIMWLVSSILIGALAVHRHDLVFVLLQLSSLTSAVSELMRRNTTTWEDRAASFIPPASMIAWSAVTRSRISILPGAFTSPAITK